MATTRCATLVLSHAPSFSRLIKPKGTTICLLAILCLVACESFGGKSVHTLQIFGVRVEQGRIVYPLPSHVAVGLFNLDPLLDVAYCAEGKVQVYQNLGNGLFDLVGERSVVGVVEKMEWRREKMFGENIPNQFSWGELAVTYSDRHSEMVTREQLIPAKFNLDFTPQIPMPQALDFREVWRSRLQSNPTTSFAIDDLDGDGSTEAVYSFFPNPSPYVDTLVVYANHGHGDYVIDWDTVITGAYGPFIISDIDKDGHKEVVLVRDGQVVLLECFGPGQYRYYSTNIGYQFPPFKVIEADIDHDGRNELVLLTSNPSPPSGQDPTLIYVAEYSSKGRLPDGSWMMSFNQQVAHYGGYTFDMAVGQIDGTGSDEIIPSGGSFGINEPVPIEYLWFDGTSWLTRSINTGLQSGTMAEMFVNLDADTALELFIGGIGPIGHGSCYALDHVSDTTWQVMWADSSLVSSPFGVNAGVLGGQFVVAGANTWERVALDTLYSQLHVYLPSGVKLGMWQRDTASVNTFSILDIDHDGTSNLVAPIRSKHIGNHLADYEYLGSNSVTQHFCLGHESFELSQNYPNPFNPGTSVRFTTITKARVKVMVLDITGKVVAALMTAEKPPGTYLLHWNGLDGEGKQVASGVYFARMIATSTDGVVATQVRKMLLLR